MPDKNYSEDKAASPAGRGDLPDAVKARKDDVKQAMESGEPGVTGRSRGMPAEQQGDAASGGGKDKSGKDAAGQRQEHWESGRQKSMEG